MKRLVSMLLVVTGCNLAGCATNPGPQVQAVQQNFHVGYAVKRGLTFYENGQNTEAFAQFYPAALAGDPEAQFYVASLYDTGRGVEQNRTKAMHWYRQAAAQGHLGACNNIAVLYDNGLGVKRDSAEALTWFLKAAEQGHSSAMTNAGLMYANGRGTPVDGKQAVHWLSKGAEAGDLDAQVNLGLVYEQGLVGVASNIDSALLWFNKAADVGDGKAMYHLGRLYLNGTVVSKDPFLAAKWLRDAADAGIAEAQVAVANLFREGRGVQRDVVEAVYWYRYAAEQGDIDAFVKLGEIFLTGEYDVAADAKEAEQWLRAAAEQGDAKGQFLYGQLMKQNNDMAEAMVWWRRASEQGYPWAQVAIANHCQLSHDAICSVGTQWRTRALVNFERMARDGDSEAQAAFGSALLDGSLGVTEPILGEIWLSHAAEQGSRDAQKRLGTYLLQMRLETSVRDGLQWLERAAEAGDPGLQRMLGDIYRQGVDHVPQLANDALSLQWYERAATSGDTDAMMLVGWAYEKGQGTAADAKSALKWYNKAAQEESPYGYYALGRCYDRGIGVTPDKTLAEEWFAKAHKDLQATDARSDQSMQQLLAAWYLTDGENYAQRAGGSDLMAPAAGVAGALTSSGTRRVVNVASAYLREDPGASGHVIGELERGQSVVALETDGDWVRVNVASASASQHGWVYKSVLSPLGQ